MKVAAREDLPALAPEIAAQQRPGLLRAHWPEYLSELGGLAWVMLAAGLIAAALWYPGSPVDRAVRMEPLRRLLMGIGMATAVVAFIYSPFGKRSGAHINPAVTLAFLYLRKITGRDAAFYIAAQFCGAVLGVAIFAAIAGAWASDPKVNYIVTQPGPWGITAAFVGELLITFAMMLLVLFASNAARLHRYTGALAGLLLASLILVESPVSGTSLNPARSFGSAAIARQWTALWVYFTAPPAGGLLAAFAYVHGFGRRVLCAKLYHPGDPRGLLRCIFRCEYRELVTEAATATTGHPARTP